MYILYLIADIMLSRCIHTYIDADRMRTLCTRVVCSACRRSPPSKMLIECRLRILLKRSGPARDVRHAGSIPPHPHPVDEDNGNRTRAVTVVHICMYGKSERFVARIWANMRMPARSKWINNKDEFSMESHARVRRTNDIHHTRTMCAARTHINTHDDETHPPIMMTPARPIFYGIGDIGDNACIYDGERFEMLAWKL